MSAFACRNCAGRDHATVYAGLPDRFGGATGRYTYVRCRACGLVQMAGTPADLDAAYSGYRMHNQDSPVYELFRRVIMGRCYPFPRERTGRVLDVGCGNGWWLREMRRRGWETHGCEFSAVYARDLTAVLGLPVYATPEELAPLAGTFDLVTFHFSFEHLDAPLPMLALAARCLRPGGELFVSLPNLDGREARLFGERWFHLDAPRHLTFFTRTQTAALLERHGFTGARVASLPVPVGFAGSMSYVLAGRFHPLVWYGAMPLGLLFSLFVRDGVFAVTARK